MTFGVCVLAVLVAAGCRGSGCVSGEKSPNAEGSLPESHLRASPASDVEGTHEGKLEAERRLRAALHNVSWALEQMSRDAEWVPPPPPPPRQKHSQLEMASDESTPAPDTKTGSKDGAVDVDAHTGHDADRSLPNRDARGGETPSERRYHHKDESDEEWSGDSVRRDDYSDEPRQHEHERVYDGDGPRRYMALHNSRTRFSRSDESEDGEDDQIEDDQIEDDEYRSEERQYPRDLRESARFRHRHRVEREYDDREGYDRDSRDSYGEDDGFAFRRMGREHHQHRHEDDEHEHSRGYHYHTRPSRHEDDYHERRSRDEDAASENVRRGRGSAHRGFAFGDLRGRSKRLAAHQVQMRPAELFHRGRSHTEYAGHEDAKKKSFVETRWVDRGDDDDY